MSFFDTLRPGSFRGVAFEVQTAEKSFGPRVVVHEFVLRDEPAHEFMGRLPKAFTLDAILVGDDVLAQLAKLEEALDDPRPGRLVHPYYGEFDAVVVGEVRTSLSTSEGRIARLSIPFQLAGAAPSPVTTIDTVAAVDRSADLAIERSAGDFSRRFSVAGATSYGQQAAADLVRKLTGDMLSATRLSGLNNLLAFGEMGFGSASLLAITPAELTDSLGLGRRLLALFRPSRPAAGVSDALSSLSGPAGLGADVLPVAPTTPSRAQASANQEALITLVRNGAAIESVRAGTVEGWESRDQALAWRERSRDALDHAADRAAEGGWDDTWRAVTDLRTAAVRDVTTRAAPLPRLGKLRPTVTTPAVVVAYQLNGDDLDGLFNRADDLTRRNRIRHPGFVPGGRELEVIADD